MAELRGDGEGLKARVYVIREGDRAGGSRELSAPTHDCTELAAAMALAISIAVDPDALDRVDATPGASADSVSQPETWENSGTAADTSSAPPAPPQATSGTKKPRERQTS